MHFHKQSRNVNLPIIVLLKVCSCIVLPLMLFHDTASILMPYDISIITIFCTELIVLILLRHMDHKMVVMRYISNINKKMTPSLLSYTMLLYCIELIDNTSLHRGVPYSAFETYIRGVWLLLSSAAFLNMQTLLMTLVLIHSAAIFSYSDVFSGYCDRHTVYFVISIVAVLMQVVLIIRRYRNISI